MFYKLDPGAAKQRPGNFPKSQVYNTALDPLPGLDRLARYSPLLKPCRSWFNSEGTGTNLAPQCVMMHEKKQKKA